MTTLLTADPACFALLDDAQASDHDLRSRLYSELAGDWRCDAPGQLDSFWARVEAAMANGLHALVLADYEWGARLQGVAVDGGCLRVLLFRRLKRLSRTDVDAWLARREAGGDRAGGNGGEHDPPAPAPLADVRASVDEAGFAAVIDAIHAAIAAGETYQVNFSYRLDFTLTGSPLSLYRHLRWRQPVPFGALIALPDGDGPAYLLSCSPELFVEHRAGVLRTRPMKGTAPRTGEATADDARAQALRADPKNRAENLMIVDLLRNDLGRIARTGAVQVPALFSVERYASVLQMTSTIEAQPRPDVGFGDVLRALFPCGSITGAPKRRTMEHIARLESRPRGIYTGAIGWVASAGASRLGEFCLSVPIRTVVLRADDQGWLGEMGVGAGIVIDSRADEERAECRLKAAFLTGLDAELALFETVYATREEGVRGLERHLARLSASAQRLGFCCDLARMRQKLHQCCAALPAGAPWRLRLELSRAGGVTIVSAPISPLPSTPAKVWLAALPVDAGHPLLAHKTTWRRHYDDALTLAASRGAFDVVFHDAAGRLTEGARSNLFLRIDGAWLTPALAGGGILPGTMRAAVLADPAWGAREAELTVADLPRAERIVLTNALRGALEASLVGRLGDWHPAQQDVGPAGQPQTDDSRI